MWLLQEGRSPPMTRCLFRRHRSAGRYKRRVPVAVHHLGRGMLLTIGTKSLSGIEQYPWPIWSWRAWLVSIAALITWPGPISPRLVRARSWPRNRVARAWDKMMTRETRLANRSQAADSSIVKTLSLAATRGLARVQQLFLQTPFQHASQDQCSQAGCPPDRPSGFHSSFDTIAKPCQSPFRPRLRRPTTATLPHVIGLRYCCRRYCHRLTILPPRRSPLEYSTRRSPACRATRHPIRKDPQAWCKQRGG